ncbi:MAG: hypothetical protein Tsb0021_11930 [Chlamydiales bacterium]
MVQPTHSQQLSLPSESEVTVNHHEIYVPKTILERLKGSANGIAQGTLKGVVHALAPVFTEEELIAIYEQALLEIPNCRAISSICKGLSLPHKQKAMLLASLYSLAVRAEKEGEGFHLLRMLQLLFDEVNQNLQSHESQPEKKSTEIKKKVFSFAQTGAKELFKYIGKRSKKAKELSEKNEAKVFTEELIPEAVSHAFMTLYFSQEKKLDVEAFLSLPVSKQLPFLASNLNRLFSNFMKSYFEKLGSPNELKQASAFINMIPFCLSVLNTLGTVKQFFSPRQVINEYKLLPSFLVYLVVARFTYTNQTDQEWILALRQSAKLLGESYGITDYAQMEAILQSQGRNDIKYIKEFSHQIVKHIREQISSGDSQTSVQDFAKILGYPVDNALAEQIQNSLINMKGNTDTFFWNTLQHHMEILILRMWSSAQESNVMVGQWKPESFSESVIHRLTHTSMHRSSTLTPEKIASKFLKTMFPYGEAQLPVQREYQEAIWELLEKQFLPSIVDYAAMQFEHPEKRMAILMDFVRKSHMRESKNDRSNEKEAVQDFKNEIGILIKAETLRVIECQWKGLSQKLEVTVDAIFQGYSPAVKQSMKTLGEHFMLSECIKLLMRPLRLILDLYVQQRSKQTIALLTGREFHRMAYEIFDSAIESLQLQPESITNSKKNLLPLLGN